MNEEDKEISEEILEKIVEKIVEEIHQKTQIPCINLKLIPDSSKPLSVYHIKIGGVPYMPKDYPYPTNCDGKPLVLLAQLNFSTLPKLENYPQDGILQFYIFNNDSYGLDWDAYDNQDNFRVVYHKEILPEAELKTDIPAIEHNEYSYLEEYSLPFEYDQEFELVGELAIDVINTHSEYYYNYEKFESLVKQISEKYIGKKVLFNDIHDKIFDKFGAKYDFQIGGYPDYTQGEPRDGQNGKYDRYIHYF